MKLPDHKRFDYSAITQRPAFSWPSGDGLAFYIGLNFEHFAFGEGLGGELAPGGPAPDVLNYAWREYGNRVGVWRLLEVFEALSLPCSVLVNSRIYDHCPEVMDAFRSRGDEVVGHGRTNAERQNTLDEAGEMALISDCTQAITDHESAAPAGWLGPWIAESHHTPDLLKAGGYQYVLDWSHDDQPVWMRTQHGPLLSVPYPQELNDIPAIMVRRASAEDFADMIVAQFDEMREQAKQQPLVMGLALHAYIVGQPFRLRALKRALRHVIAHRDRVWITTAGEVAAHYAEVVPFPDAHPMST